MEELYRYNNLINIDNIWGDCTDLYGNAQNLTGDVSGLHGYVTGLSGDATDVSVDVYLDLLVVGDITGLDYCITEAPIIEIE